MAMCSVKPTKLVIRFPARTFIHANDHCPIQLILDERFKKYFTPVLCYLPIIRLSTIIEIMSF